MIVSIHQPQYLPYLGFFNKVMSSDEFIFLDDVEYSHGSFINRNTIKGPNGNIWLTVPVLSGNKIIKDIKINNKQNWMKKHLKSIKLNYSKTDYFNDYISIFEEIYSDEWQYISELDIELIKKIFNIIGINVKSCISSELDIEEQEPNMRIIKLCKKIGTDTYLSGVGGKNYMDLDLFRKNNIKVIFQNFKHPEYDQKFGSFVHNMSIVDALFNCGKKEVKKMIGGDKNENISNITTSG